MNCRGQGPSHAHDLHFPGFLIRLFVFLSLIGNGSMRSATSEHEAVPPGKVRVLPENKYLLKCLNEQVLNDNAAERDEFKQG